MNVWIASHYKIIAMQTKKTIAIIGATSEVGYDISKRFSKGNYRLLLCSYDYGKVNSLVKEIRSTSPTADVDVINCCVDKSWEADIIIVAGSGQHRKGSCRENKRSSV